MAVLTPHVPKVFMEQLDTIAGTFPDGFRYDKEHGSFEFKGELSFELRVSISYLKFVCDIDDIRENIDIILADFGALAMSPPANAGEGDRRYFLLTKMFFYELLRVRDAFQRFLRRHEEDGLMSKEERYASRKQVEEQLAEHYLFRNAYLHGHSLPRSEAELDLQLLQMASKAGYVPRLVPLNGGPPVEYPQALQTLAARRQEALESIASDVVKFFQNIIDVTTQWIVHHRFSPQAKNADDTA